MSAIFEYTFHATTSNSAMLEDSLLQGREVHILQCSDIAIDILKNSVVLREDIVDNQKQGDIE
jgi:hypothetical protein